MPTVYQCAVAPMVQPRLIFHVGLLFSMPRRTRPDDLNGPTAKAQPFVPPDLGLGAEKEGELWVRLQHLRNRWKPLTENPDNLTREIYEILEWLLTEDPPGPSIEIP